jgi:hypothetical protein
MSQKLVEWAGTFYNCALLKLGVKRKGGENYDIILVYEVLAGNEII